MRPLTKTKSGSYIYSGTASAYQEFRTRIRVLQHKEKQRREVLKDMRGAGLARSQSPRKWTGKTFQGFRLRTEQNANESGHPTEDESSGMPANPSSTMRARPAPVEGDEDVGSLPSHCGQTDGGDDSSPGMCRARGADPS